MEKYYITTPIYYVNDKPHIGHAYTTILADTISRFRALIGEKPTFLTGLDEHGQKVEQAAINNNISPKEHCDLMVPRFKELWDKTEGLDPNDFESNYNARPTPKSNQAWRISKYLALELINAIDKSEDKNEIIDAFVRYASSQGDESSVFVKAS